MRLSTLALSVLFALLQGCNDDSKETGDSADTNTDTDTDSDTDLLPDDADGDGLTQDQDCDDTDPEVGGPQTVWTDADGDGFGDAATVTDTCTPDADAVTNDEDCDDAESAVNPDATELCNGVDDDCDDTIDVGAADPATWYADADSDGYGDAAAAVESCEAPAGTVADATDCDDADPAFNPGADESDCTDPADYNCDGSTGYADADGDGYVACQECDDGTADVNPGALETCNGVDDDCDGDIDTTAADAGTWYDDADGDTYGDPATATVTCFATDGAVADGTDCDDTSAAVNPGAAELCDGAVDEDCDGLVDDADSSLSDAGIWYLDVDGDGYGDPATGAGSCDAPALGVPDGTDCDDARAGVNPGATEVCDSLDTDEDCDGAVDDADTSLSDARTWYVDADGDTFGTEDTLAVACDQPDGYAALAGDCDDTSAAYRPSADESDCSDPNDYNCDGSVGYTDGDGDGYAACEECDDREATTFPGADEYCDLADNDCDGAFDEPDAVDAATWYDDADEDGYGDPSTALVACDAPEGYGTNATDCDDTASRVSPAATEVCDAADVDEDCDALVDDADASVTGRLTSYTDADSDGFGDDAAPAVLSCDLPRGSSTVAGDCDDADGDVNPDAAELCDALDTDEDCDGFSDDADPDATGDAVWYIDLDGDGFGDSRDAGLAACDLPSGYVTNNTDCDDASASIRPGGTEVCDARDVDEDCDGAADDADTSASGRTTFYTDVDADGYGGPASVAACDAPVGAVTTSTDCDDAVAAVNPGATEVCDAANTDEDCDGAADDADPSATGESTYYTDADGDGRGGAVSVALCDATAAVTTTSDDCDDASASVYPGATETCNGDDDDCDGTVDEADALGAPTWYADADRDTYGDAGTTAVACAQPSGYVASATDCDDTAAAINPGASEVCDAADTDEDCDGAADDADTAATGKATWHADTDADTYGDPAATTLACDAPRGFVADAADCDDGAATINPMGVETCNSEDDDCDGTVDEDSATDARTWYRDADTDGYGVSSATDVSCAQPSGYVATATDCDDTRTSVNPGAAEVCDASNRDEDCDGSADDLDTAATGKGRYYADADRDTYGTGSGALYCDPAVGLVTNASDCDDTRALVSPVGTESCNGLDDNCDGTTDGDDSVDVSTWYADADGDTYGDPIATDLACYEPVGFVADDSDCDDSAASINPMGTETCNSEDDDCDGTIDEGATDFVTWYRDADGDTYGNAAISDLSCSAPSGYVARATDCDDTRSGVNPGAAEVCDASNRDEDCDGSADDLDTAATGKGRYYADADRDTYGTGSGALYCDPASTLVTNASDCDDTRALVNPVGTESCNGLDDNCDGTTDGDDSVDVSTWYADADNDTYGDPGASDLACYEPVGFVADASDCDDSAASVNPMGVETCNSEDDDCDGTIDDGATDFVTWYRDADGDTYGNPAISDVTCSAPSGYVASATDCDDTRRGVNPGAAEVCDVSNRDEDCDGSADDLDTAATGKGRYYTDADEDTYGTGIGALYCDPAPTLVTNATDCDDTRALVNPAGLEVCNTLDDNCDGVTDGDDAADVMTWYADADEDTYGDIGASDIACYEPVGFVADDSDCDDSAASINPMGVETCNGEDDDCDGAIDDSATDFVTWYADLDGDTYGTSSTSVFECEAPADYVATSGDCNDGASAVNPGATEVCDASDVDEDCDGLSDDADSSVTGEGTWYADVDGDGYGVSSTTTMTCDAPSGYAASAGDCDDAASGTNPGATEVCNDGANNDCVAATTCRDWAGAESLSAASASYTGISIGATSTTTTGSLGGGVVGGKDINGDGYADVLLADRLYDFGTTATANTGRTYLLKGSATGLAALASATATFTVSAGTSSGDRSGQAVAMLDDIDSDGDDEVMIGAYASNYAATDSGEVRLFRGSSTISGNFTQTSAHITLGGPATANVFTGWQVEQVGDVNNDGVADWAASSSGTPGLSGTVMSGTAAGGTYTAGASTTGILANLAAAGAGAGFADDIDITGDGVSDLVSLAFSSTGGSIFEGGSSFGGALAAASADTVISGTVLTAFNNATSYYGHPIANAGDNNGDGYEDLLLGADGFDTTATDVGRAYLFLGPITASTLSVSAATATVTGSTTTDAVGKALGGDIDVDGDGYADFVVGAPGYDGTGTNIGAAALLYGPTSGAYLLTTAGAYWTGTANSNLGSAARGLGDVDADGYDDFFLGAPLALNSSSAQVGLGYLFYGAGE